MRRKLCLLLLILVQGVLVAPSGCITVSYSSGSGGETSSVSGGYILDYSTWLKESTSLGGPQIQQSRYVLGQGDNRLDQSISGRKGAETYSTLNRVSADGSLAASTSSASAGGQLTLGQSISAQGAGSVGLFASYQGDAIGQSAELRDGSMISLQGLGLASGEIATSGAVSLQGSGETQVESKDDQCQSSYQASTDSSAGDGCLNNLLFAAAGSPKVTFGSVSATGDKVVLSSQTSNPQGTYLRTQEETGVKNAILQSQEAVVTADQADLSWSVNGSGTINPIDELWTSTDGNRSVVNRVSGQGDSWQISRDVSYGADYVDLSQSLFNQGSNSTAYLDSAQVARDNGSCEAYNGLHSTGSLAGMQWAGSSPGNAYASQSLIVTGSITGTTAASSSQSGDYSQVIPMIANAANMQLESSASAAEYSDTSHKTRAHLEITGQANSASTDSYSRYGQYTSDSHGGWGLPGSGKISISAKTMKAALSDVDLSTDGDRPYARTTSHNGSQTRSGLSTGTSEDRTSGSMVFQAHLYSHAYPKNDGHVIDEFASTAAVDVLGSALDKSQHYVGASLLRWDEDKGRWDEVQNVTDKHIKVFRADDITTSRYKWNRLFLIPVRGKADLNGGVDLPAEPVPWGIKMMYNNSGLVKSSGGSGVDVAVIDTGVDTLHPDLFRRVVDYADMYGPGDYGNSNSDPDGHGTHVSGTIVADGGYDGKGIWGMAPEASLHMYKTDLSEADVARGINRSVDLGADVISISLGGPIADANITGAVNYAIAKDVLVVAAAGNGIPEDPVVCYPAAYPGVVAAGAVTKDGDATWWTSPGNNDGSGVIGPEDVMFGAPGRLVYSTLPTYKTPWFTDAFSWYGSASGTSMATPHIAGLAAKVMSANLYRGFGGNDTKSLMQAYARNNDVQSVWVGAGAATENCPWYAALFSRVLSEGAPKAYYKALFPYMDGNIRILKLDMLKGDDCLTGLGIPKLPAGST
ncbi:MAG TPA: S8 family serine peptidase [Methanotrichaceae archaeon]|nr:S8 family serine peptidase [Methanotrichaceae archaeon]